MVTQYNISNQFTHFTEYFNTLLDVKCPVNPFSDSTFEYYRPTLQVGMYTPEDYGFVKKVKGRVFVIWCGNDAATVPIEVLEDMNTKLNIVHISTSHHITRELKELRNLIQIQIPFTNPDHWSGNLVAPGQGLLVYAPDDGYVGGSGFYNAIRSELPVKFIEVIRPDEYSREDIIKVYQDCFAGIRLRTFEGSSATVAEMALLGRPFIWNGYSPGSRLYTGVCTDIDVRNQIMELFKLRREDGAFERAEKLATEAYHFYSNEEMQLKRILEVV